MKIKKLPKGYSANDAIIDEVIGYYAKSYLANGGKNERSDN